MTSARNVDHWFETFPFFKESILFCDSLHFSSNFKRWPSWIKQSHWRPLLFITLIISSLLAWNVSIEKSADSLMETPSSVTVFLLLLWNSLFVLNLCHSNYFVFWCRPLWVHLVWDCVSCTCVSFSFTRLGKVLVIISSNRFPMPCSHSSHSSTPITWMLLHFICPKEPLNHPHF